MRFSLLFFAYISLGSEARLTALQKDGYIASRLWEDLHTCLLYQCAGAGLVCILQHEEAGQRCTLYALQDAAFSEIQYFETACRFDTVPRGEGGYLDIRFDLKNHVITNGFSDLRSTYLHRMRGIWNHETRAQFYQARGEEMLFISERMCHIATRRK